MTAIAPLPYQLDRVITIEAPPESVFSFFTDPNRWARWWGAGSTIDARPGGQVLIRHANGIEVVGEVLSIDPPTRIAFTYGFAIGHTDSAWRVARHHRAAAAAGRHPTALIARVLRRDLAQSAHTGLAVSARAVRECGHGSPARRRTVAGRSLVHRVE